MMKRVPLCRQGEDDSSIVIYHGALVIEVQLQLLFLTHVGLKHSGTIMIILIIAPTLIPVKLLTRHCSVVPVSYDRSSRTQEE